MRIFITAGGTEIPIDSVRYIHNMSTGRFGKDLAEAALLEKNEVFLFRHKTAESPFEIRASLKNWETVKTKYETLAPFETHYEEATFKTYNDYASGIETLLPQFNPDIIIAAAAVSDYGLTPVEGKISSKTAPTLELHPLAKILPRFKEICPKAKLVGFKLLVNPTPTEKETAIARTLTSANCDVVAYNNLTTIRKGKHQFELHRPNRNLIYLPPGEDLATRFLLCIHA
jgi:phosphopantothenoylcysteine synthetase/decarboxylase